MSKHRVADGWIIGSGVALGVTVLVPWLFGRMAPDTFLLPTKATVPLEIRGYLRGQHGGYFGPEYLTGLSILCLIIALLLILRPWRKRAFSVVIGFVLILGTWGFHTVAVGKWDQMETAVNATQIYPYDQVASTCGMSGHDYGIRLTLSNEYIALDGHKYYTWTGGQVTQTSFGSKCSEILVFRDLQLTRTIAMAGSGESVGSLCDTNGTAEGILWFYEGYDSNDYGAGFWTIMMNDTSDAQLQFMSQADFPKTYPMCDGQ